MEFSLPHTYKILGHAGPNKLDKLQPQKLNQGARDLHSDSEPHRITCFAQKSDLQVFSETIRPKDPSGPHHAAFKKWD